MILSRLTEKIDLSPCSSDGMRLDAWRVALQGTKENLYLPASQPYSVYYRHSEIGMSTMQNCGWSFITVHNFYLEHLYLGGILWLLFLLYVFTRFILFSWRTILGKGFIAFLVFLGFSPTFPHFYPLLLLFMYLIYTQNVEN